MEVPCGGGEIRARNTDFDQENNKVKECETE